MFTITRKKPPDCVSVLVVNTYTFGVADFYKAKAEFPDLNCIVLAGDWCAYTLDAKEVANAENIGLLTPKELVAAVWREEPHKHFTKMREAIRSITSELPDGSSVFCSDRPCGAATTTMWTC